MHLQAERVCCIFNVYLFMGEVFHPFFFLAICAYYPVVPPPFRAPLRKDMR
jgi:hypothetical protein